jgi:hypothetical protein
MAVLNDGWMSAASVNLVSLPARRATCHRTDHHKHFFRSITVKRTHIWRSLSLTAGALTILGLSESAYAGGFGSTVGGGVSNTANGSYSTVAGGANNNADGSTATISGGDHNSASGNGTVVAGGSGNLAPQNFATVSGGYQNAAEGHGASVSGGLGNFAVGDDSTVAGGSSNTASGDFAIVAGGNTNNADGAYSFAAGQNAKVRAQDDHTFIWSDGQTGLTGLTSTGSKQFIVSAVGGFGLNTPPINNSVAMTIAATNANPNYAGILLHSQGMDDGMLIYSGDATKGGNNATLYVDQANGLTSTHRLIVDGSGRLTISNQAYKPGGGSWAASSDARLKTNVKPLGRALDRMLALKGVTFEYSHPDDGMHPSGTFTGFIAQDVEKLFPNWIGHDNEGYLTVGPQGFEALTVEALRDLKASQDDRVAKLERDNADLRELVANQTKAISDLRREVAAVTDLGRLESRQIAAAEGTP